MFVYLAWKGISSCVQHGHNRVFLVAFVSYLCIGLGSVCFHSTLKCRHSPPMEISLTNGSDPMQLVDELSMIYTTCVMFYGAFSFKCSTKSCIMLAFLTTLLAVFITVYYHFLGNPVFHQVMFAGLTAAVVTKSIRAMETTLRPSKRRQGSGQHSVFDKQEQARIDRRDIQILRTMWQLIRCGLCSVAMGFLIWNLDNEFCSVLRRWRRELGLPWGLLLEGHGWWYGYPQ